MIEERYSFYKDVQVFLVVMDGVIGSRDSRQRCRVVDGKPGVIGGAFGGAFDGDFNGAVGLGGGTCGWKGE